LLLKTTQGRILAVVSVVILDEGTVPLASKI
jgi:hypothetical protein